MNMIKTIFFMAILGLAGCAHSVDAVNTNRATIAPGINMNFPPLTDMISSVEATQMITANYSDESYSFQNQLSITPEHLLIVFYDPMGRSGLTIDWDKDKITYQKSGFMPDNLPPQNILADFILTNWPASSVRKALAGTKAVLTETKNGRKISLDGKTLIEIEYEPSIQNKFTGRVIYQNLIWGYKLDIHSARQML